MCGNRVEELEAQVKELEASVEGLTDELVACKVRLRELEQCVDEEQGFTLEEPTLPSDVEDPTGERADRTKPEGAEATDNPEDTDTDAESEIIVA